VPRQLEADKKTADQARKQQEKLERVLFGEAWFEYIEVRKPYWSELHYRDHLRIVNAGG